MMGQHSLDSLHAVVELGDLVAVVEVAVAAAEEEVVEQSLVPGMDLANGAHVKEMGHGEVDNEWDPDTASSVAPAVDLAALEEVVVAHGLNPGCAQMDLVAVVVG
jgi:hypothetical protein